jgi:hypothetical protein
MSRRTSLLWALLVCAAAESAEPPESQQRLAAPATPATPSKSVPVRPPLDLRIGDVRKYMTPEEYRAAINGSEERNTVVVEANRPLLPMKSELDVPGGILAPFWALAHPTQAWRIFLPDPRVNIQNMPPLTDKIPPPVFRWGP